MQIERIFYPVKTLGYGLRIGIWTIGCPHGCFNCSNPELWNENPNKDISMKKLFELFSTINGPIDGLTVTGGEPFSQPNELYELIKEFKLKYTDDILIYTGYTIEQLQSMKHEKIDEILNNIAVLIDGLYIEELNDNQPLRGSSNQRVHILNSSYREKYESLLSGKRTVQTVFNNDEIISIGIPLKGFKTHVPTLLKNEYGIKATNSKGREE